MLSQDDATQTTGAIERLPRIPGRRSALSERRQSILQQRHTDLLPEVVTGAVETPHAKFIWRQLVQLREENRRLRFEQEEQRSEMQRLIAKYNALQTEFDKEAAAIHSGYQQETEHYQSHMREMMEENKRLRETQLASERRYQELFHDFQNAAREEAHKMVTSAARTLEFSPEDAPDFLHDAMKTLELHARQVEDAQLVEVLYLKRQVQQMVEQLQQERQQIDTERQQVLVMRHSAREQAKLRHKALQARLRAQWIVGFAFITTGVLLLLIILQILFLFLLRVHFTPVLMWAIIGPIVVCTILAIVLVQPLSTMRAMYLSAPHKHKVKQEA